MIRIRVLIVLTFVASNLNANDDEVPANQFFNQHCKKCHSGRKAMGDFAIASLKYDFGDKPNREQWLTVLGQLQEGSMPPKSEPRPPANDLQGVMDWIRSKAEKAEIVRRETEGRVVMRRLNRAEYANTVRQVWHEHRNNNDLITTIHSRIFFDTLRLCQKECCDG